MGLATNQAGGSLKDDEILLITKEEVNKELPSYLTIEDDVRLKQDTWSANRLWDVTFIVSNGSRQVNKRDSKIVIATLQRLTGKSFRLDEVSNFVIHYVHAEEKQRFFF